MIIKILGWIYLSGIIGCIISWLFVFGSIGLPRGRKSWIALFKGFGITVPLSWLGMYVNIKAHIRSSRFRKSMEDDIFSDENIINHG